MYQDHFGLAGLPFSIAPDPRYLYMSRGHQEALAHLLYGLAGEGGFVLLTGEVGTGKTTVCRCLLEQVPASCDVAYIFNPRLTVAELLSTICSEFGIACPAGNTSVKVFVDRINAYLLDAHAKGRNTVLIIDEAQNLSPEVLEQMRLLTNLETNERKLLQIMLIGQPELAHMLARPELRQLAQRIVARYHLRALTRGEVAPYVRHRLGVSGAKADLIPASLIGKLHRMTGGVPRLLNLLCDRALLGAYAQGRTAVDRATLDRAAREVLGTPRRRVRRWLQAGAITLALAAAGAAAVALYQHERKPQPWAERVDAAPAQPSEEPAAGQVAPPAAVLTWPLDEPPGHSRTVAHDTLLAAWGEAPGTHARCDATHGALRCRSARGGLAELRALNRPAILQMRDAGGRDFHACLVRLDADGATFAFGERTQRVGLDALAHQWTGHYTVMWRMPAEVGGIVRPGERGPAVLWLRQQLAQVHGSPATSHPLFDEPLVRAVRQFQLERGLVPDGTAGIQTLMHLAGATDTSAPRLNREEEAR